LLVAAISPIPYVFFVWMSGAFGMKLRDFFYFGAIPRTLRILVVLVFIKFVIL
jgi:membrane protein YqaA with SNARE-associated domain